MRHLDKRPLWNHVTETISNAAEPMDVFSVLGGGGPEVGVDLKVWVGAALFSSLVLCISERTGGIFSGQVTTMSSTDPTAEALHLPCKWSPKAGHWHAVSWPAKLPSDTPSSSPNFNGIGRLGRTLNGALDLRPPSRLILWSSSKSHLGGRDRSVTLIVVGEL